MEENPTSEICWSFSFARIMVTLGGCEVLVMISTGMSTVAWFVVIMLIGLLQPAGAHFIGLKFARQ